MDVIGWSIFLGLLVLLVPMLPFLVIGFLISKVVAVIDRMRPRGPIGDEGK